MAKKPIELTTDSFDEQVLQSDLPVLVDFWSSACPPCRRMSPVVDELAEEYDGKAKVCKVSVDDYPQLAGRFGIMSVPTFMFFDNGEESDRVIGAVEKGELSGRLDR